MWHYALTDVAQDDDDPRFIRVDYMYCIDEWNFVDNDWAKLLSIFRMLPGNYEERSSTWFGGNEEEERPPYLVGSVEPPGLQVSGVLAAEDWRNWHSSFVLAIEESGLPLRHMP